MKRFLKSLFATTTSRPKAARRTRIGLESLEERCVLDSTLLGNESNSFALESVINPDHVRLLSDGTLFIQAEDYGSEVSVFASDTNVKVYYDDVVKSFARTIEHIYYGFSLTSPTAGMSDMQIASNITSIAFYGRAGKDFFANHSNIPCVAFGFGGNDSLNGGSGRDYLEGGEGDDIIIGNEGRDTLSGGQGVDRLYGNDGGDTLYGGGHNDQMFGGGEDDIIYGGAGNDAMYGGDGADTLYGNDGHDDLDGGGGLGDMVAGAAAAADNLFGGAGIDFFETGGIDYVSIGDAGTDYVPYDGATFMVSIDDTQSRTDLVRHNPNLDLTYFLDLRNQWHLNQSAIHERMVAQILAKEVKGEHLYNLNLQLQENANLEVAQDDAGTYLRLTIPGNRLDATSTQPTDLGSWADPRFAITFDIVVMATLAPSGGLRLLGISGQVVNVSITPLDVAGEVAAVFAAIAEALTGEDYWRLAEEAITAEAFDGASLQSTIEDGMSLVNTLAPNASVTYDSNSGVVLLRTARQSPPLNTPSYLTSYETLAEAGWERTGYTLTNWTSVADANLTLSATASGSLAGSSIYVGDDLAMDYDWFLLNPQPLPPYEWDGWVGNDLTMDFDWFLLNPQPVPPSEWDVWVGDDLTMDFDWWQSGDFAALDQFFAYQVV